MVFSFRRLSVTLTAATTLGWTGLLLPSSVDAHPPTNSIQIASAKYAYNDHLVRLYTYECAKKLQEVQGETANQASQICQCSISKMQQQYPQSQAIKIFNKAQTSMKNDPKTMPSELSPFFSPCLSTKG